MKKAFTLIELVLVIVVVGVLSTMVSPNFQRNGLQEAANQLVSHIRYTQHLAMMDNKFDSNDANWFKGRWQIKFFNNTGTDNQWAYTIYSDWVGAHTGNPDKIEIAKNPLDQSRYLTGGTSGAGLITYNDAKSTKELNIGIKYGIKDVDFSSGCRSTVKYISFDSMGRPFNSFPASKPYELASAGWHKLLDTSCVIDLCLVDNCTSASSGDIISIEIKPETGYTHIL